MTLQRVRKEDLKVDTWVQPDGFDLCMACWIDYMRCDDRDLGASRMLLGAGNAGTDPVAYESDPFDEQRRADMRIGEATDAMIDSLCRLHIWAIYKAYGIGQVWNFPHADFVAVMADAKAELEKKLRKNVATCNKFC